MPLNQRNRGPAVLQNDFDGLIVERIGLAVTAALALVGQPVFVALAAAQHAFDVVRRASALEIIDDVMHLLVGNEGAMHPRRVTRTRAQGRACRPARATLRPPI